MVEVHCSYTRLVPTAELVPNPKNPNKHGDKQIKLLAAIIKGHGWRTPITVSKRSGYVVRGHGRLMAAQYLGLEEVPVDEQDYKSEASEWADMIADNRIAELSEIDPEELQSLVIELEKEIDATLLGYTEKEMQEILSQSLAEELHEDDFTGDDIDSVLNEEECLVGLGDVWELGRHRLICGDCTDAQTIDRLMNGKLADVIFTDPPYNVNYEGGTEDKLTIANDNLDSDTFNAFLLKAFTSMNKAAREGAAIYVCHADSEGSDFRGAMLDAGWLLKQCLIWAKDRFTLGRQDYQWQHEPILYGWKPGAAHSFYGGRKQGTVVDIGYPVEIRQGAGANGETHIRIGGALSDVLLEVTRDVKVISTEDVSTILKVAKPTRNGEHPTMKPIALCGKCIANSSKEDEIVLDLFGGSGSTLIAAEQLNRTCYMSELDPKYCEVIIRRWEEFTGKKAVLSVSRK